MKCLVSALSLRKNFHLPYCSSLKSRPMKTPRYSGPAILNLQMLAEMQEMSVTELSWLMGKSHSFYRALTPVVKSNGNIRQIYAVLPPLQLFQRCLVDEIFHQVEFPPYIQGSIKADKTPRGFIENAKLHAPYRFIVRDD